MISTQALHRALAELRRNLALLDSPLARERPDLVPTFRAAVIQSFEFTYEMAIRLLERAIEDRQGGERVDEADFRTRMRMGLEAGLVESLDAWIEYRSLRNATSHTYNERKAIEVCAAIPAFVTSATRVLAKLEEAGGAS